MKPFYIWAGGKTKLIKHYAPIWPQTSHQLYVEPFFGGGAIYGWLYAQQNLGQAVINDVNLELISILQAVRDNESAFLSELDDILDSYLAIPGKEDRKVFYYNLRKDYWKAPTTSKLFALMRLGFNGIWQTCKDSNGLFGTPAGLLNHTKKEQIYTKQHLDKWSQALQKTSIYSESYENVPFDPQGALIYLDPPYRDSFTTYGTGFNDEDQRKLVDWSLRMHTGGATVLFANRCIDGEEFFEELFGDKARFHYFDVTYTAGRRKRVENGFEAKKAREFLAVLP